MLENNTIKIGKIFPSRKNNSKYGRPPTEKSVYCEIIIDNDRDIVAYNFYFIKTFPYLVPKGWKNPGRFGNRCYKKIINQENYETQEKYNKILNNPSFNLYYNYLFEIENEIFLKRL